MREREREGSERLMEEKEDSVKASGNQSKRREHDRADALKAHLIGGT